MRKYLVRRALFALATLVGVSLIIFVVLRVLPGDPLVAILGVEGHARMTPADRVKIMHDLGLSDPLPLQYLHWLRDIASGQLGKSFFRGDTVAQLILHRGPISAEIGLLALIVSWLVGLPIGILSAVKPNSIIDNVARSLAILFIAIPGFWLGMLIVLALLFWFGYKAPIIIVHLWESPWQNLQIVIGPAVVLGLAQGAYIARMARSCLLEVIHEDPTRCCPSSLSPACSSASCWGVRWRSSRPSGFLAWAAPSSSRSSSATSSWFRTSSCSTPSSSCWSTSSST